jgi:hypothetical protein
VRPLPLVLWLVSYACESVGWRVERGLHGDRLTVTEDRPNLTHRPRQWILTAEEVPYGTP